MVNLTDIGEGYNALHCLTNFTTCCRGADGGSAGEWFLPGQISLVVDVNAPNAGTESFTKSRGPSTVLLNHRTSSVVGPTGLYTCQVPDGSGTNRTLYIGVYIGMGAGTDYTSHDMHNIIVMSYVKFTGVPAITDLDYDRASGTLTCISSGGPVDSVIWMKDGSLIIGDNSAFSQMQTITSTITSTFHHTLSSSNSSNFVGSFTCTIRDAVGNSNSRTQTLNGMAYW